MSQTTRAHRMSQKAHKMGGQKMQLPFILAIFKAFMEDGKDIADYDVLAENTEEAGVMSKDQVRGFFFLWI